MPRKNFHWSIPGIKTVSVLSSDWIEPNTRQKSIVGMKVAIGQIPELIETSGKISLSWKIENEKEGDKITSVLSFSSPRKIVLPENPVFIVETVDGERFGIGSKEFPRAVVNSEYDAGVPDSQPRVFSAEIKWCAKPFMI